MIYLSDADFTLYNCDVLEGLAQLEDESVHCVVTSPPYWGLRDYGTGTWQGGDEECDHATNAPLNESYCQLAARRTSQLSLLGEDASPTERAEASRS